MAPHTLVLEHLDLVERLARKLQLTPHSRIWNDAIQAGRMGLIDAASRYDASLGTPFRAYAREFVVGEIKDAISTEPVVRPSRYTRERGAAAAIVELDDAYASRRVPGALVDLDTEDEMHDAIERRRRIADVRAAVRSLPSDERGAIRSALSGEPVPEYAERHGIGVRTAAYVLADAKESLRLRMAGVELDEDH